MDYAFWRELGQQSVSMPLQNQVKEDLPWVGRFAMMVRRSA
jgi:hypothetical protein